MGVVYLAENPEGKLVALKRIRAELASDPAFRSRFRREIQLASRVSGLCTAAVLGGDAEGAEPFLATEFISGPTLDAYIARHGPLENDALAAFAVGLAEALQAIHEAGIVHRDLKPSNVILSPEGPRVIDFGIARAADGTAITRTGVSVGTPAWMAPEQRSCHLPYRPLIRPIRGSLRSAPPPPT